MLTGMAERAWLPDPVIRFGVRRLLRERLRDERRSVAAAPAAIEDSLRSGPIAESTGDANDQHYEVPAEFFRLMLGPRRKYSCCLWQEGDDLAAAEERSLAAVCARAGIDNGMRVLDLGCGWGSASLWIAEHYPRCRVTGVSNSRSQGAAIREMAAARGLDNVDIHTADVNGFDPGETFDRVVSIEMFEHMRNYEALLARIRRWLAPDGRLFVHIFTHRALSYFFERDGRNDWMARHFFSGGVMPARDLLQRFDRDLRVEQNWDVNGMHYARTLRAWLDRLDRRRDEVLRLFGGLYGSGAGRRMQRWRMFLLACEEMFAFDGGNEWGVTHYRLAP